MDTVHKHYWFAALGEFRRVLRFEFYCYFYMDRAYYKVAEDFVETYNMGKEL